MAYNETLADRVREVLADLPNVTEKYMFRGVVFMVNDKMCVGVADDELMCRVDPELTDELVEKPGCQQMTMGSKTMKGFVFVDMDYLQTAAQLNYWIQLALDFNPRAKASPKKKGKK
jgi:TfoX/Sxy family transcriptional regulator of competence genes